MKKNDSSKQAGRPMDYKTALQKSAALCSRQEQCTSHIREKLMSWQVQTADADRIIKRLTDEKFLDDSRYAGYFVRDKFRLNGWGKVKIAHMLRTKKVEEEIIQQSLDRISDEAYLEKCTDLILQKASKLGDRKGYARKGKLFRFASGRGFEPEIIHRALQLCGE